MRAVWAATILLIAAAALTVTPTQHDFGRAVVHGLTGTLFTLSSTPGDPLALSITGPDAADFEIRDGFETTSCADDNGHPIASCSVEVTFRPKSLGVKTATLEISNRRGQRATASLRGEAIRAGCQPVLVPCNWVGLYSGSIQIVTADSVVAEEHIVHYLTDITISVKDGVVSCTGTRREHEKLGYPGKFISEMTASGPIAGAGLLAIEFTVDEGKPVYLLTYACPTPTMTRTSTDLNSGNSETETFPGSPADWRDSELLADPQPSTGDGMIALEGRHTTSRYEPENFAGGITKVMWQLKRP